MLFQNSSFTSLKCLGVSLVTPFKTTSKSLRDGSDVHDLLGTLDDSWGFGQFRIIRLQYRRTARTMAWLDDSGSTLAYVQFDRLNKSGVKKKLEALTQTLLLNQADSTSFGHPFHLVNPSMLPAAMSAAFLSFFSYVLAKLRMTWSLGVGFEVYGHLSLLCIPLVICAWMIEISAEESRGAHTLEVQAGFRIAILLFIASEFMLFISFFWAFFHFALNPSVMSGSMFFAPVGIAPLDPERLPWVNTHQLIMSGITLTFGHNYLMIHDREARLQQWLGLLGTFVFYPRHRRSDRADISARFTTNSYVRGYKGRRWNPILPRLRQGRRNSTDARTKIAALTAYEMRCAMIHARRPREYWWYERGSADMPVLWVVDAVLRGAVFLAVQTLEYVTADFNITDSVFGSLFYSITGLHGFHVLVGLICLACFVSYSTSQFVSLKLYPRLNRRRIAAHYTRPTRFRWWNHRVAFEGSVWYWHFVDAIWLVVMGVVYIYPYRWLFKVNPVFCSRGELGYFTINQYWPI